jgi:hypothetical protein
MNKKQMQSLFKLDQESLVSWDLVIEVISIGIPSNIEITHLRLYVNS